MMIKTFLFLLMTSVKICVYLHKFFKLFLFDFLKQSYDDC